MKYIAERKLLFSEKNINERVYLPYLSVIGTIIAFLFAVFKYLHDQRLSEQNKRFEQFHKVFEWVSGRTAEGKDLVDTQQAMAVYQLSEFSEYAYMWRFQVITAIQLRSKQIYLPPHK